MSGGFSHLPLPGRANRGCSANLNFSLFFLLRPASFIHPFIKCPFPLVEQPLQEDRLGPSLCGVSLASDLPATCRALWLLAAPVDRNHSYGELQRQAQRNSSSVPRIPRAMPLGKQGWLLVSRFVLQQYHRPYDIIMLFFSAHSFSVYISRWVGFLVPGIHPPAWVIACIGRLSVNTSLMCSHARRSRSCLPYATPPPPHPISEERGYRWSLPCGPCGLYSSSRPDGMHVFAYHTVLVSRWEGLLPLSLY